MSKAMRSPFATAVSSSRAKAAACSAFGGTSCENAESRRTAAITGALCQVKFSWTRTLSKSTRTGVVGALSAAVLPPVGLRGRAAGGGDVGDLHFFDVELRGALGDVVERLVEG